MNTIHRRGRNNLLRFEQLEERTVLASYLGQIGGPGNDGFYTPQIVDSAGNSYIAGSFYQTADFGASSSSTTNSLASAGLEDAFLAKYAPDGTLLWAKRFGGAQRDWPGMNGPVFAPTGNSIYLPVLFDGNTDVTGDGVDDLTTAGGIDACILKIDGSTGQTQWFKRIGGKGDDLIVGVGVDSNNRLYAVGSFRYTVDFDPGPGSYSLTSTATKGANSPSDGFVLTLDSSGGFVSAWKIGGKGNDEVYSVKVDGSSLYLLGLFESTVDFDLGPNTQNRTSAGYSDQFLAQYSTSGSLGWVQTIGHQNDQGNSYSLNLDGGSLYLSGSVTEPLDFDPSSSQAILSSGNTLSDAFLVKYSKANGSYVWAKQFGGPSADYGYRTIIDSGVIYLGGGFNGTVDFNPSGPGGEHISAGGRDGFVLKLDAADGSFLQDWVMGGAGNEKASPTGVTHSMVDGVPHTTLYVSGSFQQTASFPTGGTLTSAGSDDIFRMALDQADPAPVTSLSASSTSSLANDLALLSLLTDADGNPTGPQKKRL